MGGLLWRHVVRFAEEMFKRDSYAPLRLIHLRIDSNHKKFDRFLHLFSLSGSQMWSDGQT